MPIRNTTQVYGSVAKFFHWAMFMLIVLAIVVGLRMGGMEGEQEEAMEWMHRSWGLVILILLVLRLGWKLINPRPASPPGPALMNLAAGAMHWGLYGLILLQASAGIILSQAGGETVSLFGLFDLPQLVAESEQTEDFWEEIHEINWIVIAVVATVHTLGALHHHFGVKDDVLRRMWFGSS
jgi:cytochrome b561